jgi:acetyl-CoA C-acetyltransferase
MAAHIRNKPHSRGMVTTVSGIITKQGFGIWGADPNPDGYQFIDVTTDVAAATDTREVVPDYAGAATVTGFTILYDRQDAARGVAVVDLPDGRRSIASCEDHAVLAAMAVHEFCGVRVRVNAGRFSPLS